MGFALLFPSRGADLPTLYSAASDRPIGQLGEGWGPDTERVWGWKDELPRRGLAWYGRFVRGRPSFLSPALLADLYPRSGEPDDFREAPLSPDALRIAEIVLLSGPTSTALLREALDAYGTRGRARFDRALHELGKRLVLTHHGVKSEGSGWPAAVLELTARAFPVGAQVERMGSDAGRAGGDDPAAARLRVAERFLDTMIFAMAHELGNAFGIGATVARAAFEDLVSLGRATGSGPSFRIAARAHGATRAAHASVP